MPNRTNPSVVVFSDVDRPLADPFRPAFLKAASVLERLPTQKVALVLCSGKTRAELEFIRARLAISGPFICEHGGAVMIPAGHFDSAPTNTREVAGYQAVEFGRPYEDVVEKLHRTAARLKIQVVGFSDMSIEDVANECQIPLMQARLAKLRDYEELFRIVDGNPTVRRRFFTALQGVALRCSAGHPFNTISAPVDHRIGVNLLTNFYRRELGEIRTVGITDASRSDNLVGLVDHSRSITGVEFATWSSDVVGWAESIVHVVERVRERNVDASTLAAERAP